MNRVRLVIFNAALGPLDYRVPEGMDIEPGSVVVAPLGPRQIVGIVWEADRLLATEVPESKLRPLIGVLPVPPLRAELRRLIEWTADYYCASLASVARMVLASGGALRGPATMIEYRLTGGMPERMTPQRLAAIEALEGEQATIRELAGIAGVSPASSAQLNCESAPSPQAQASRPKRCMSSATAPIASSARGRCERCWQTSLTLISVPIARKR